MVPTQSILQFFDVDWDHPAASLNKRILAPFLGRFYGECLEDGEIALEYGPDGFKVAYYNIVFPLRIESYLNFFKNLAYLKKETCRRQSRLYQTSRHPLCLEVDLCER